MGLHDSLRSNSQSTNEVLCYEPTCPTNQINTEFGEVAIRCGFCRRTFHRKCCGVNSQLANELSKGNDQVNWNCTHCAPKVRSILNGQIETDARLDALESRVDQLEKAPPVQTTATIPEGVITGVDLAKELKEIEFRKPNIVIFNLDEPTDNSGVARKNADHKSVLDILGTMKVDKNSVKVKVAARLGTFDETKRRPLKVVFSDAAEKEKVLKMAINLKNSKFNYISVKPDLTKNQVLAEKELYHKAKAARKPDNEVHTRGSRMYVRSKQVSAAATAATEQDEVVPLEG